MPNDPSAGVQKVDLASADPDYAPYLKHIRRLLESNLKYPCQSNRRFNGCEYIRTDLLVEFAIDKNGNLLFAKVVRSSGLPLYDEAAIKSLKDSRPFPARPEAPNRPQLGNAVVKLSRNGR